MIVCPPHHASFHVCRLGIFYNPFTLIPGSCRGSQTWPPLMPSTKPARCTMPIPQRPLSTLRMHSTWHGCKDHLTGEEPRRLPAMHMTPPQCNSSIAPKLPQVTVTGLDSSGFAKLAATGAASQGQYRERTLQAALNCSAWL